MKEIKTNDVIKVHYTGSLKDGTVFDSSVDREPFEFKVGEGKVIKGFEDAVLGMQIDETKSVTIPSDEAYGPVRKEMVSKVNREHLPEDINPEVGMELISKYPDGKEVIVRIQEVAEDHIVVDGNHPLAGKDLIFEIKVVEVK